MQTYMHALKLKRALYVAVNKNTDEIYTERVAYDKAKALAVFATAELVVGAPEPLTKISTDPSWFACKFCDHRAICQLGEVERLERNCRTCASSTPLPNGRWVCEHHGTDLDVEAQRAGCEDHLFIPALLKPWEPIAADEAKRIITYTTPDGQNITDTGQALLHIP
jgi:hypothetical protein